MTSWIVLFSLISWNVWKWSKDEVISCVSELGVQFITDQVSDYIDENLSRNVKKTLLLRTNGKINLTCINTWPYVLSSACEIAQEYEDNSATGRMPQSGVIAVWWKVSRLLRESFGILWKSKFVKPRNNERPELIEKLIVNVQLAGYITYTCCHILVCLLCVWCVVGVWLVCGWCVVAVWLLCGCCVVAVWLLCVCYVFLILLGLLFDYNVFDV